MVGLFGTNDKLALEVSIVVVALAIGAGLGIVARSRLGLASIGFALFGVVGFLAALRDPLASAPITAVAAAVSVALGIWVLGWLVGPRRATAPARVVGPTAERTMPDWSRRSFMVRAGGVTAAAVVAGIGGRALLDRQRAIPDQADSTIPPASVTVPALGADQDLQPTVAGLTPIVMPNERFYRIDTTLLTPIVETADWSLRIHGLVDRETTLTWEELVGLPMFEQYVTIACVSNEVGGKLVGNAKWTGVRLREVLAHGRRPGVGHAARRALGGRLDRRACRPPGSWTRSASR